MKTIDQLANEFLSLKSALIFCHVRPDGDTVGSALALQLIFEQKGIACDIVCDGDLGKKFAFLAQAKLVKKIEEIKNKKCELTLDDQEALVVELQEKVDVIQKNIDEITHKIEVDSKLIEVLGDEGLRMYFFKKLLPVLNHKINHYLQKFELPVTLEFDSFMNETIKTGKFQQEYNQFSGGERCRIDMAILLSFFDIAKIISNWSCSVMMIDEILDAGVDQDGISQFISTLYNIVSEENKDLGIYVISHKLSDVQVAWNETIEITKKSLYSELKIK